MRLYSCQCSASTMLRDPATSKADAWKVIHHELVDAKLSTESVNCSSELWRKAEELVGSLAQEDGEDRADLGLGASPGSEHPSGTIGADVRVACFRFARDCEKRFLDVPCVSAPCNNSQALIVTWKQERVGSLWRPQGKKTLASSRVVAATRDSRTNPGRHLIRESQTF